MSQQPAFEATNTPADITDGLAAGCYVGQPIGYRGLPGVRFATAASAPADADSYFQAAMGDPFTFRVGSGIPATWVVLDPDLVRTTETVRLPVALARTGP